MRSFAASFAVYRVTLAEALKAQATAKFVVRMVFVDVQQPHPAAISQNDVQLVRYTDNHYYAAAYATTSQRTSLKLGSSAVESFSQLQPTTRKGAEIIYGSYDDVAAFSSSPLSVHFENNAPFIKAVRATKEIEISHWGNAAVEMQYDLLHAGARLKGVFSRYEFQRNPGRRQAGRAPAQARPAAGRRRHLLPRRDRQHLDVDRGAGERRRRADARAALRPLWRLARLVLRRLQSAARQRLAARRARRRSLHVERQ